MKKLAVTTLSFYQIVLSPALRQVLGMSSACRYPVTCSEFAKQSIQEYGIMRGGGKAIKRVLSCQPFGQSKPFNHLTI